MYHSREEDTARYLSLFCAVFPSTYSRPGGGSNMREMIRQMKNFCKLRSLQSNAAWLLATILGRGQAKPQVRPLHSSSSVDCSPAVQDWAGEPLSLDPLCALVSLLVSLPCLHSPELPPRLPTGRGLELHCLKLVLVLHCAQLLAGAGWDTTTVKRSSRSAPVTSSPLQAALTGVTSSSLPGLPDCSAGLDQITARLEQVIHFVTSSSVHRTSQIH